MNSMMGYKGKITAVLDCDSGDFTLGTRQDVEPDSFGISQDEVYRVLVFAIALQLSDEDYAELISQIETAREREKIRRRAN